MCMIRVVTFSDSQAKPTRANGSSLRALVAADVVEIGARLVREQHRLRIKRVDQPRGDAHLRVGQVRFVHRHRNCHRSSPLETPESLPGRRDAALVPHRDSTGAQAMMSGMLESTIRWIWSLS